MQSPTIIANPPRPAPPPETDPTPPQPLPTANPSAATAARGSHVWSSTRRRARCYGARHHALPAERDVQSAARRRPTRASTASRTRRRSRSTRARASRSACRSMPAQREVQAPPPAACPARSSRRDDASRTRGVARPDRGRVHLRRDRATSHAVADPGRRTAGSDRRRPRDRRRRARALAALARGLHRRRWHRAAGARPRAPRPARAAIAVLELDLAVRDRPRVLPRRDRRGAAVQAPARACTEPIARAALDRILVDEVRHRDFGWDTLDWLATTAIGDRIPRAGSPRSWPALLGELVATYGDRQPGDRRRRNAR